MRHDKSGSLALNGNLTLSTQAEVDAFHYTEITGSLTIGNPEEGAPSSDITSLKPLLVLTKVDYMVVDHRFISLVIVNNDYPRDLRGIENIS